MSASPAIDPASTAPAETLRINEVFYSIQGESTRAGCPCVFIRLTGCHLRCTYCDTEYAFKEGLPRQIDDLVDEAISFQCPLVEITGGEPLLQKRVHELVRQLADRGLTVLIETSGACDISPCDPRCVLIMDLKTPGSGEADRNDWGNIARLRPHDEVKFVVTSREDYEWARAIIAEHHLPDRVSAILMSAVFEQPRGLEILGCCGLHPRLLAEWILADHLPVRMQFQLHKFIWEPQTRGV